MGLKNTTSKITKRVRELGKQQLVSELGCLLEYKKQIGHNIHRMKCLFDTAGLGLVETNASQIDIDGIVNIEVLDAVEGFLPLDGVNTGNVLGDLKGEKRQHEGLRFNKAGIGARGIEYKDKLGDKWQGPLIKENKIYNAKLVMRPLEGTSHWCRVSAGLGGSRVGVGQKIKCDSRQQRPQNSIL